MSIAENKDLSKWLNNLVSQICDRFLIATTLLFITFSSNTYLLLLNVKAMRW